MKKTTPSADVAQKYPGAQPGTSLKASLLLGSSLLVMANAAIAPSLVKISQVFHSVPGSSLLMSLPAIAVVAFSPFVGRLLHHWGERKILLVGLFLYALAGSSGLWCDSIYLLWLGRLMLGVSIAICMTVINHLIGHYFKGGERARFISTQSMAVNLGGIIFVLLSGALVELSWRLPFALYLLSLPVMFFALMSVTNTPAAIVTTRLSFTHIRPILPLYLLGGVGMLMYYITLINIPFMLSVGHALSAREIGLVMASMSLISALVAISNHRLKSVFGDYQLLTLCFGALILPLLLFVLNLANDFLVICVISAGVGFGLLLPMLTSMIIERSPIGHRPQILSGFVMSYFIGQALSAPVFQWVSALLAHSAS